ncbi:MAG: flagellar type III secretion system pore protein FliP [Spirochaetes bacterium]|nr:flagellar type III secretion system pore protein FliP [Spirochaetota bacterium]
MQNKNLFNHCYLLNKLLLILKFFINKIIKSSSFLISFFILFFIILPIFSPLNAQEEGTIPIPFVDLNVRQARTPRDVALSLEVLLLVSLLTLAPSIIISVTSYVRLIIVFDFLKRGLGTQQMPPSQVMAGLALFLTFMIMMPTFQQINNNAIIPYMNGKINLQEFYNKGIEPLRIFMFNQTRIDDIRLFLNITKKGPPATFADLPTYILIPAFILSELKTAFNMGILIMIPFVLIDMMVSATLMSMGMIMLPPVMISLPFKIIIFVLVNGWDLLIGNLVKSFRM